MMSEVFSLFPPVLRRAIREFSFDMPTEPQVQAIPVILQGKNVLLVAPTGTGKTEAAFLPILSTMIGLERSSGIKLLYVTPLRALNRDLLGRLEWWCKRFDLKLAVRHGDTPVGERNKQSIAPPDILITTPETFQAILPARRIREHLRFVKWVIVDEVQELSEDKRGAQLSLGLERLRENIGKDFQVIGLSATVGSPDKVAKFLVGAQRDCRIINVNVERLLQVDVKYPQSESQDYDLASRLYMFPEVAARLRLIRKLVEEHKSTLVFTNTRVENEVLGSRFRVWDDSFPIAVHHGSLSRASRVKAENELKDGILKGIICTSSLEMGIDVGRLDLVIQYNSPRQVTRLVQRVGRSGHKIGLIAKGVIITQDSDDFLESAVIAKRAVNGILESTQVIDKPLDVLAHQLAGMLLDKPTWYIDEILEFVRRSYVYRNLSREELLMVVRYMSEMQPRLAKLEGDAYFRKAMKVSALYNYYFNNLSMIPVERQYLVVDSNNDSVGILDESFVSEYGEIGLKFILRGSLWKIENISGGKVYVKSESDPTGAIPFWVGEEIPVPFQIAQEVGKVRRTVEEYRQRNLKSEEISDLISKEYSISFEECNKGLKEVYENLEQGFPLPTDKKITVEKWREYLIIQTCWGHLVNRTIGRAVSYLLSNRFGYPVGVQVDPYRIVLRALWATQEDIVDTLKTLATVNLEDIVRKQMLGSGIFKKNFVNTAKKFGAISKEANLTDISINRLIEAMKDTAIVEEAYRSAIRSNTDLEESKKVLTMIEGNEVQVQLVKEETLTPLSRIGIEELSRRAEIVPPEKLKHIIAQVVRARLLEEAFILVCTNCWKYSETFRVKQILHSISCPICSSKKVGVSQEEEERVKRLISRIRSGAEKPPISLRRTYKRIIDTSKLIEKYGGTAAFVLAERSLATADAESILEKHNIVSDELVQAIIDVSRKKMRKRFP